MGPWVPTCPSPASEENITKAESIGAWRRGAVRNVGSGDGGTCLRAVESNAGMVPVKGIVGYGRFTARFDCVVTQHCKVLGKSLNKSGTAIGDAPMSGTSNRTQQGRLR